MIELLKFSILAIVVSMKGGYDDRRVYIEQTKIIEDTVNFKGLEFQIVFNDFEIFDTCYELFQFDLCAPLHSAGYRFSNSFYFNEDTLSPFESFSNDSLLNLTIHCKPKNQCFRTTSDYLQHILGKVRLTMKASGHSFTEPKINRTIWLSGIEIGLIGWELQEKKGKYLTSLEVYGITESTIISGKFLYFGTDKKDYLRIFEQISYSLILEKL